METVKNERKGEIVMKKNRRLWFPFLLLALYGCGAIQEVTYAEGASGTGDLILEQQDKEVGVMDPETLTEIDPGEIARTEGPLRIDFAPRLSFGLGKVAKKDIVYSSHAQMFKNILTPRGSFIQVSDYRGTATGWTLQVRQENQFQQESNASAQLNGATISFDKAWTNSTFDKSIAPSVSKEIITMSNVGETYNIAEAKLDQGVGTWSIVFGASGENAFDQENTLKPLTDEKGKPLVNPDYNNQQLYSNTAINLTIPGAANQLPGTYSTVLTWIIAELP